MSKHFTQAGFTFLQRLKQNNDRDWFRDRKDKYQELIEEPMKALVLEIADSCRARGIPLHAKEKSPVMRVYRDIRFSKDKTPFKTHVAAELRKSFRDSEAMLYMHLHPKESFVAAGVWQPERPLLYGWRETIAKEADRFRKMEAILKSRGLALSNEYKLSKGPRGFEQYGNEPFAEALKLTSFVTSRKVDVKDVIAPDFAATVVQFAADAQPLLEFAWLVEESTPRLKRQKIREEELV